MRMEGDLDIWVLYSALEWGSGVQRLEYCAAMETGDLWEEKYLMVSGKRISALGRLELNPKWDFIFRGS